MAAVAGCMIAAMVGAAQADPPDAGDAKDSESKRLLKLYLDDVRELQFYRDAAHRERLAEFAKSESPAIFGQDRLFSLPRLHHLASIERPGPVRRRLENEYAASF